MSGTRRLLAVVTSLAVYLPGTTSLRAQPAQEDDASSSLDATVDALEQLVAQCNNAQSHELAQEPSAAQTQACCSNLEAKIQELDRFHRFLPVSGPARGARREAQLSLVDCHAKLSNFDRAQQALEQILTIDELRGLEKDTLVALKLEPLIEQTQSKLSSPQSAQLRVKCTQACEVWINWTRRYDLPATPQAKDASLDLQLPFSTYVVAVVDPRSQTTSPAANGLRPFQRILVKRITFSDRFKQQEITFQIPSKTGPDPVSPEATAQPSPPSEPVQLAPKPTKTLDRSLQLAPLPLIKPILPRTSLQLGVGLGLLATATGSALIAANGYCTKGGVSCPAQDQWKTKNAGIATLVAGSVVLSTSIALLIAERIRGKRAFRTSRAQGLAFKPRPWLRFGKQR